jgi:DNA modification methylase
METVKPYYEDSAVTIYHGNTLEVLPELKPESIQCVVTSPPYWGLRKYTGKQDIVWGDNHCEHE